MNQQRPKQRRKKRTKNLYFTKVHENAIVQYAILKIGLFIKLKKHHFKEEEKPTMKIFSKISKVKRWLCKMNMKLAAS